MPLMSIDDRREKKIHIFTYNLHRVKYATAI